MNVSLTPELERYVQKKVESGRYTSASEVVREALRSLQDQEARQNGTSTQDQVAKEMAR
jgi:antitoxin ParD1/3/4